MLRLIFVPKLSIDFRVSPFVSLAGKRQLELEFGVFMCLEISRTWCMETCIECY
jgi:hypothetical protein